MATKDEVRSEYQEVKRPLRVPPRTRAQNQRLHCPKAGDTGVRCIMRDDRSGVCIIHPRVLAQMKLEDKILSCCISLTGFSNAVERISGEITLPVLTGGVTLETMFHIMDQDTTYNTIIRRPWIHIMRVIPSILYQVIKFPTLWGIFSIRGEQRASRECYRISLDSTSTQ
uniref:Uncharacterized protein n=1 Tax=Nicotiana tabacum TaxID=4097 RepID=A0A1S3XR36_TOBAC|nr:PREDICTED: uncharacterized protein LOC107767609 [Nicotiana tabacum]